MVAKLSEIGDEVHAMYTGDEARILRTGQFRVEAAAEAHGPRYAPLDDDAPGIGFLVACDHLEKRRLARPVAAQKRDRAARRQGEREVIQDHPARALGGETLGQMLEPDHGPSPQRRSRMALRISVAMVQTRHRNSAERPITRRVRA